MILDHFHNVEKAISFWCHTNCGWSPH